MHKNSLKLMTEMFEKYAPDQQWNGEKLYDIGSYDVNGNYRALCEGRGWHYVGMDIAKGKNVDIVLPETNWRQAIEYVGLTPVNLVISGSTLEHVKWPWVWIGDVKSLLNPGGFLFLHTHTAWPIHRHPVDCWRILPDGMAALAEWADMQLVGSRESYAQKVDGRDGFDCWAVMRRVS